MNLTIDRKGILSLSDFRVPDDEIRVPYLTKAGKTTRYASLADIDDFRLGTAGAGLLWYPESPPHSSVRVWLVNGGTLFGVIPFTYPGVDAAVRGVVSITQLERGGRFRDNPAITWRRS